MNCNECQSALDDYIDRRATAAITSQVEAHLDQCAACRTELESLRRLRSATLALPKEIRPARDLWPEINGGLEVGRVVPNAPPHDVRPQNGRRIDDNPPYPGALPSESRADAGATWLRWFVPLATAAIVVLAAILAPNRPGWKVSRVAGTPEINNRRLVTNGELRVGQWLETDALSRARVSVGSIGEVRIEPNSRLRLVDAARNDHRLELARGTMHALIWAPPRLFFVNTPSATAIDLGCAYTLSVDEAGAGTLYVTAGYVALDDYGRETIVPAYNKCHTRPRLGPGTPFADDAPDVLRRALDVFDVQHDPAALRDVITTARPRDAITLWHLLSRTTGADRVEIFDALAHLRPPPAGVTRAGILAGNETMRHAWGVDLGVLSLSAK